MNIRKRLSCVNRGTGLAAARENGVAIDKIITRYVDKMKVRGWSLDYVTSGDAFFQYEAYVHMSKNS